MDINNLIYIWYPDLELMISVIRIMDIHKSI